MGYEWRYYNRQVDANAVGKELERLEAEHGELRDRDIVEAATPEDSIMHPLFEWNDGKAAKRYRLSQAASIRRDIIVEVERQEAKPLRVRAYMSVSDRPGGRFINVMTAFQNPESREVILQRALKEIQAFKKKYEGLQELAGIFAAVDEIAG